MSTLRGWSFGLALAVVSCAPAMAGDVHVEKRDATRAEVLATVTRYGSMPGGGRLFSHARHVDLKEAHDVVHRYGSLPGGVVLEGSAPGIGAVSAATYESATGSFKIDGKLTYKPTLSPLTLAQLARAIATDDRIGISITEDDVISYGALPVETVAARDLAVADTFLADLILPPREWTVGYRLANGYTPQDADSDENFIVLFRFQNFDFSVADETLKPTDAKIDVVVVPVSEEKAADGGYLVNADALNEGLKSEAIEANAKHVSENFTYYLEERAATRAIAMGQAAAFFRHLKAYNVDLGALAGEIEKSVTETSDESWDSLKDAWNAYIEEIKASNDFAHWTNLRTTELAPPAAQ